jgi:conjugal transfer pilus assembly protein TraW
MSFSKVLVLAISLLSIASIAQQFPIHENPMYWAEKSQAIMDGAENMSKPAWLNDAPSEETIKAAEKLMERSEIIKQTISKGGNAKEAVAAFKAAPRSAKLEAQRPVVKVEEDINGELARSYIFVSQSMPRGELKAAIEESTDTGAVLIFRGIKPGQAIDHIMKFVAEVLKENTELKPSVVIDPSLFTKYNISSVPTVVVHLNGKMLKATGTLSIDYALAELEDNKSGDIGVVGPSHEVSEPDMIEEMKRRTALIDWNKQKAGAADRYWTESWPHFNLPVASENNSFLVDPTFTLNRDIVAQGKVLARAGSTYNAQKIMPMRSVLAFFDANDDMQIKAVKKYVAKKNIAFESVVLVIVDIDRTRGFEAMNELNETFGKSTKVMEKGMIERFKLKSVPSIVTGSGDFYKVEELAIDRKSK